MRTVIINREEFAPVPDFIMRVLPYRLTDSIRCCGCTMIEEIRLRRGKYVSLTSGTENIVLNCAVRGDEMDSIFNSLCSGSVYAHRESIANGYICLENGIRVGVCGHAAVENGKIIGISEISSIVIRLPHRVPDNVGGEIAELLRSADGCGGILVYSKPGVGKTTVLRGAARILASGENAMRVAVVDTREELSFSLDCAGLTVDILASYPKKDGISIAARTLNAQVIICDEIGDTGEAEAIMSAHNCGVPLIASAHASDMSELMRKPGIAELHASGCFGYYVGITRNTKHAFEYEYKITDAEEANAFD